MEFSVKCSYFEIYNEIIYDLLREKPMSLDKHLGNRLQVRECPKKGVYIDGILEEEIFSSQDALNLLIRGAKNRHVDATFMNLESSRSHSLFQMHFTSVKKENGLINTK